MKWLGLFKFYGLYPISTWFIKIHCEKCLYEGKSGIDWYNYTFFICATLFVIPTFLFAELSIFRSFSTNSGFNSTATIYIAYLGYFFRPQKYYCPKCKGNHAIPLSFYQYLNRNI